MTSSSDDILIIGGGAIGLATALALLEAGRGVRVLEAQTAGSGASHGNCGTITPSHAPPLAAPGMILQAMRWMLTPGAPLYVKPRFDPALWRWLLRFAARCNRRDWHASTLGRAAILNDSRTRMAEWIGRYGLQCEFVEEGMDYVFREQANFERNMADCEALREFGIASEFISGRDYLAADPSLKEGLVGAIRFPGDARLRPDRYVAELARVVRERGGTIEEGCRVESVRSDASGARARTSLGERRGREAVIALGAWSPQLAKSLGFYLPIQPGKGYSITYSRPSLVPKRPITLKDRSVCVTVWDSGFRLGSTMEFSGYDTSLNETRLGMLESAAREYLREPVGAIVEERWYGWRPMSSDDMPVIDRAPGHDHLWLATGHGMLGVSMSAATGQLVADLVGGRPPAIDPAPYRADRFR
ncbi:FAD-dependent oxidoreductase [Pseudoxanthomonas sangjuensis]|uniref:NAD(P)/FAD-dependent oxidoreductase n=1 Tax=Pseudoxanthomonas sangjuensis TaxID=1503750 RepID=UPI001390B134|nr:FAD-dependent oxidoreductase [Pseudoxanthomonas sangjuensis]KAF1713470.1 amino acid dehydrogenase [Pseudoxanthomonas sangjuensis]